MFECKLYVSTMMTTVLQYQSEKLPNISNLEGYYIIRHFGAAYHNWHGTDAIQPQIAVAQ
jgi:hypothetical protein